MRSLAASDSGDLWVGLFGGTLARIRGSDVERFTPPIEEQSDGILYLAPDRDGVVWVGTQHPKYHELTVTWRVNGAVAATGTRNLDLAGLDVSAGDVVDVTVRAGRTRGGP